MIMTVSELLMFVQSDESDQVLEAKLQALELLIRAYTNNNFQKRAFRAVAVSVADHSLLTSGDIPFKTGDTLQITESDFQQNMLVTVKSISDGVITVKEDLIDESGIMITKVCYPADVKMGCVNLMKWELNNREKAGVASETISRHSVTYFNVDGDNSLMGYPRSLLGFLKPYMKARFGQGLRV